MAGITAPLAAITAAGIMAGRLCTVVTPGYSGCGAAAAGAAIGATTAAAATAALIATMAALVLSQLVASAKSAYDTRSNQLVQASDIILLDRALARYGPETKDARASLQRSA